MPAPDRILFYPYWVSSHAGGRKAECWGPPCDTAREALGLMEAELDAGNATWGCVVKFQGGIKTPLVGYVRPRESQKPVKRWLDLEAQCKGESDVDH